MQHGLFPGKGKTNQLHANRAPMGLLLLLQTSPNMPSFFFLMFFDSDKALFLKLVELLSVVTTERVTFVFLADLLLNLFN